MQLVSLPFSPVVICKAKCPEIFVVNTLWRNDVKFILASLNWKMHVCYMWSIYHNQYSYCWHNSIRQLKCGRCKSAVWLSKHEFNWRHVKKCIPFHWKWSRLNGVMIFEVFSPLVRTWVGSTKFNIVECVVVNLICARLFAIGNYYAIDCLHLTSSWRHVQVRFELYWDVKHLFFNHVTTS